MFLSEAVDALLIATSAEGRSPRTVDAYQEKLGHLVRFLGDPAIDAVTTQDLRRWLAAMRDAGLSPFTIKSRVRAMKRLWNFAEAEGITERNPARRIKTPRPARQTPKGITWDDFTALLETTKGGSLLDVRDRALILLLADSGARVGGLCGLELDHLDLQAKRALVREKGDKQRTVFFQEPTARALAAWLNVRPEDKGPWVFVGLTKRAGGQMNAHSVGKMLKRRGEQAGCAGVVNPHSFRHGYARSFLLAGGDLGILSKILGHSSVAVTMEYYAVFTTDELQEKHAEHSPIARLESGENGEQ